MYKNRHESRREMCRVRKGLAVERGKIGKGDQTGDVIKAYYIDIIYL